ncbi:uncharacterized protein TNCV_1701171 [Trichonephila clavipes]|nr:uncharacterized protein TNCV_1701171 [Trichonephila clavipes]
MNDINLQFVWGMRIIGKGHSSSNKLCASLNIHSLSKAAYRSCEKKLLNVASVASKNAMTEAAAEVRKLKNTSDVAECGVSVDGTWQRRGHSSLNGCVTVLSIGTGKVLDLEVMSKWCRNCNTSKSSGKSKQVKKHQCSCNHQGSAGSMEYVGAYRLFERSRETRKLEYVEFYGDGDSKSHLAVKDIYGIDSELHINLEEMQRAVIAAFYHCCSGKSNPMHGQCPLGSESWCAYQRAQSAGKVFYDKNAGLPKTVINFNKGFTRLLSVLEALDIKIGSYILRGYAAIDQTRIEDSKRHSLPSAKVTRKEIRAIKKRKVVNTEKHEDVTYKYGAF